MLFVEWLFDFSSVGLQALLYPWDEEVFQAPKTLNFNRWATQFT